MANYISRVVLTLLVATTIHVPVVAQSATTDPPTEASADGVDWEAMTGTWIVESAERDGDAVRAMEGTRYFVERGLMRWAKPDLKSEVTKLPIMMGRTLQHVEGNKYRTSTIYPPAESADLEIAVDGDAMIMIAKMGVGRPTLTLTLKRKHNRSPKPPPEKMIGLAKEAYEKGESTAVYQFTQLQLINFPGDKEAALLLAESRLDTALAMQSGFNANELRRIREQAQWALENYPDAHDVRHKLGAFLYRFTAFEDAVKQFEILESSGQYEVDSMLKHAQGLFRLGKRDESLKKLEDMLGYDAESNQFSATPRTTEPNGGFLMLANMLATGGKVDEAQSVMDHFVELHSDIAKPYLDRGRLFLSLRDLENAKAEFTKALEVESDDREALLVNIEVRMRETGDEPDQLIERAIAKHGRDAIVLLLAGTREGIKKDYSKALTYVDEGLELQPYNQSLLTLKVQLLIRMEDFQAADALIAELPKQGVPPASAQLLRARVLIAAKEFSNATRTLAGINKEGMPPGFEAQVQQVKDELTAAMDAAASSSIVGERDSDLAGPDEPVPAPAPGDDGSDTRP